jgi:hypothetical protein
MRTYGNSFINPHLTPQGYSFLYNRSAGDANLGGKQTIGSNAGVVTNMHHIINFGSIANPGNTSYTAIDGAAGSYLNIIS